MGFFFFEPSQWLVEIFWPCSHPQGAVTTVPTNDPDPLPLVSLNDSLAVIESALRSRGIAISNTEPCWCLNKLHVMSLQYYFMFDGRLIDFHRYRYIMLTNTVYTKLNLANPSSLPLSTTAFNYYSPNLYCFQSFTAFSDDVCFLICWIFTYYFLESNCISRQGTVENRCNCYSRLVKSAYHLDDRAQGVTLEMSAEVGWSLLL